MGMYIDTTMVMGFEPAIIAMRNPMNSWEKSDSYRNEDIEISNALIENYTIGKDDLNLAQRLIKGGGEHSKFMRQIQVWCDMNMPRYFWSEMDTYKFNTKNSCSTMHRLFTEREITMHDFVAPKRVFIRRRMHDTIDELNMLRKEYLETKDYSCVIDGKRILPESFLQMRTTNFNYAELRNIYQQRKHHRLKEEWIEMFCKWVESLPYSDELITYGIKREVK